MVKKNLTKITAPLVYGALSFSCLAGTAAPGTCHHDDDDDRTYHCSSSGDGNGGSYGGGGYGGSNGGSNGGGSNEDRPPPPRGGGGSATPDPDPEPEPPQTKEVCLARANLEFRGCINSVIGPGSQYLDTVENVCPKIVDVNVGIRIFGSVTVRSYDACMNVSNAKRDGYVNGCEINRAMHELQCAKI